MTITDLCEQFVLMKGTRTKQPDFPSLTKECIISTGKCRMVRFKNQTPRKHPFQTLLSIYGPFLFLLSRQMSVSTFNLISQLCASLSTGSHNRSAISWYPFYVEFYVKCSEEYEEELDFRIKPWLESRVLQEIGSSYLFLVQ